MALWGALGRPAGSGEKEISGQASAFPLEAPGSVGGVGETCSPTVSPVRIAQAGLRVPTGVGNELLQLAGAARNR